MAEQLKSADQQSDQSKLIASPVVSPSSQPQPMRKDEPSIKPDLPETAPDASNNLSSLSDCNKIVLKAVRTPLDPLDSVNSNSSQTTSTYDCIARQPMPTTNRTLERAEILSALFSSWIGHLGRPFSNSLELNQIASNCHNPPIIHPYSHQLALTAS